MKTFNFEFLSNMIIAFLVILLYTNPGLPGIFVATLLCLAFFSVIRWVFHYLSFRSKIKKLEDAIERWADQVSMKSSEILALETKLSYYQQLSKDWFNQKVTVESKLLKMLNPELTIVTTDPGKNVVFYKIHQGADSKWYYSLIGMVGKKQKYLHNSRGYENYALAAQAILDLTEKGHTYPVYDELGCLPGSVLSKDTMPVLN